MICFNDVMFQRLVTYLELTFDDTFEIHWP